MKKRPCFAYHQGKCEKGKDCPYAHRKMTAEEKEQFDKRPMPPSPTMKKVDCTNWKKRGLHVWGYVSVFAWYEAEFSEIKFAEILTNSQSWHCRGGPI